MSPIQCFAQVTSATSMAWGHGLPSAHTLVIFDRRVADLATLYEALVPGAVGYTVSDQDDALSTITQHLTETGAKRLAIVAHGEPGVVHLGLHPLTVAQLQAQAHLLQEWGVEEIVLYSCEVGSDAQFVATLGQLTGATVMASTGKVGSAAQGGRWDVNPPSSPIFAPAALAAYAHTLSVSLQSVSGGGGDGVFNASEGITIRGTVTQNGNTSQQAMEDVLVAVYSSSGSLLYWTIINNNEILRSRNGSGGPISFSTTLDLADAIGEYEGEIILRLWQGTYGGGDTSGTDELPVAAVFDVNARTDRTAAAQLSNALVTSSPYMVDTIPPADPTIALINDSGPFKTDGITHDARLAFSEPEADVTRVIKVNGNVVDSYDPNALDDGEYTIEVIDTDAAGNTASTSFAFILDTTIATPTIALANDTGTPDDSLTNDASLVFSEPEADVTRVIKVNGDVVDSYDPNALEDGEYTIKVIDTDAAGNTASTSFTFTLDTQVTAPTVALTTDSGSSNSDRITNDGSLTVTGEDGATVEYSTNGNTWVDSFTAAEGLNTVLVRQTDIAGNTSAAASLTFTLDTLAPVAPAITSYSNPAASNLRLDGSAEANSTIAVTYSGTSSGTLAPATANASGNWTLTTGSIVSGQFTLSVTATDAAGNTSSAFTSSLIVAGNNTANDGSASRPALIGTTGDDVLLGYNGNDLLNGEAGDDLLIGGFADDILIGGAGNDTLIGGAGRDSFQWDSSGHGVDVVTDFVSGFDRLVFRASGFSGLTAGGTVALGSTLSGTGAQFVYANGQLIFDSNGTASGGSSSIATFTGSPTLVASDFLVI